MIEDLQWTVTFLVTGFNIAENQKFTIGRVEFGHVSELERDEIVVLGKAAQISEFYFDPRHFTYARTHIEADNHRRAGRRGLWEIDRTLDTFVLTWLSQSKYLPVGYMKNEKGEFYPSRYGESNPPMPLIRASWDSTNRIDRFIFEESLEYARNFEGILLKDPQQFNEAECRLAIALKWCRLGALARFFSESPTVAFVLDWIALEALIKDSAREKTKPALRYRLPKLMKHYSQDIIHDHSRTLSENLPVNNEEIWREKILAMYDERNNVFHEARFAIEVGFLDPFGSDTSNYITGMGEYIGLVETILGRVLPFVAEFSKYETITRIWDNVDSYTPKREHLPLGNPRGWSQVGG